jgi:hypothetical protein
MKGQVNGDMELAQNLILRHSNHCWIIFLLNLLNIHGGVEHSLEHAEEYTNTQKH